MIFSDALATWLCNWIFPGVFIKWILSSSHCIRIYFLTLILKLSSWTKEAVYFVNSSDIVANEEPWCSIYKVTSGIRIAICVRAGLHCEADSPKINDIHRSPSLLKVMLAIRDSTHLMRFLYMALICSSCCDIQNINRMRQFFVP